MSGQIDDGLNSDGLNGEFVDLNNDGYNTPLRENPNYCSGNPEAEAVPFPCILRNLAEGMSVFMTDGNIRQWSGSTANWCVCAYHILGGIAMPSSAATLSARRQT